MVILRKTIAFALVAGVTACGVKAPPSPLYSIPMTDTGKSERGDSAVVSEQSATPSPAPITTPTPDRTNTKKKKK